MIFLKEIRSYKKQIGIIHYILYAFYSLGFGVVLGILSKWLDDTPSNVLPDLLQSMDLRNFFSRIAVWLFLAVMWNTTFVFGIGYLDPISFLEMVVFFMTVWTLRRSWRETKLLLPIFCLFVLAVKIFVPLFF